MYDNAEAYMTFIVSELPLLKWLDISGTNLCGWVPEQPVSHRLLHYESQRYITSAVIQFSCTSKMINPVILKYAF